MSIIELELNSKRDIHGLLFGGIKNNSKNFVIKTYHFIHRYYKTNRNKLVNSYYVVSVLKRRIISQSGIKIQEI